MNGNALSVCHYLDWGPDEILRSLTLPFIYVCFGLKVNRSRTDRQKDKVARLNQFWRPAKLGNARKSLSLQTAV